MTKDEFVEKATKKHGNKYDYSKVEFVNYSVKVCIVCPIHGEFWQTPSDHFRGRGCPLCGQINRNNSCRSNKEKFILKAREKHGDKYDYSKVEYVNNKTKVCIICPNHGEFWQTPNEHLSGKGCAKCSGKYHYTTEEWVEKSKKVHGNKYDYSKVEYINTEYKVRIICLTHGEFQQTPHRHLQGQGCPLCKGERSSKTQRDTIEEFIEKAKEVHGIQYDYSKVSYVNSNTKVSIICPIHGEFFQKPNEHLQGKGCYECGKNKISKALSCTLGDFVGKAKNVHGNKYEYSKVEYVNSKTKVCITCPEHGEFWQEPDHHLQGQGCPKCAHINSKAETEIVELLQSCNPQQHNRLLLKGKEIDIYLRDLKLGIEYNGLFWHSELFGKDHRYHLDKLNECNKQGIRLVQIFEDEWVNHKDICISKLKQICGLNNNPKIYARKCNIREIKNKHEAYEFLGKNHIQGQTGCTLALGAYHNEQLVAVMCFKKEKEGFWDLNRFASDIKYQCIGLGGKLFKYFTDNYPYQEVKSFADRRWTVNPKDNLYTKLGFEFDSYVEPTYWYFKDGDMVRHHKFGFRKQPLHRQYGLPLTMTEREMTTALGYTRIWDCGLIKYVYKNGQGV